MVRDIFEAYALRGIALNVESALLRIGRNARFQPIEPSFDLIFSVKMMPVSADTHRLSIYNDDRSSASVYRQWKRPVGQSGPVEGLPR